MSETLTTSPPREGLYRALLPGCELRAAEASDGEPGMPTLFGHFAVFNRWTEIDSFWEGRFLERIAPGAFKKTFRENRDNMRVLFQHGMDPQIGDKPLGAIDELHEDDNGAYYEVGLLDAPYVREQVMPGLEAGLYGASFRFKVIREDILEEPTASDDNPAALPERTIKEAKVMEFGPVTFPAYTDATAGVRSVTDRILFAAIEQNPGRVRDLLAATPVSVVATRDTAAPSQESAAASEHTGNGADAEPHPDLERRGSSTHVLGTRKETPAWKL